MKIIKRAAKLWQMPIHEDGAQELATRARGTPRIALRLLKRVRDYAQVRAGGEITQQVAAEALGLMGIDALGLDELDRRYLLAIIEKFGGDSITEVRANYDNFLATARRLPL